MVNILDQIRTVSLHICYETLRMCNESLRIRSDKFEGGIERNSRRH